MLAQKKGSSTIPYMKQLRVLITGGGSGGHVMPALAIIEELREYCPKHQLELRLLYLGSQNGLEAQLAHTYDIPFSSIPTGKFRRKLSLKNITDILHIIRGIIKSYGIIKGFSPQIIVGTGGYVAVPAVIAGWFQKIPVLIHEQTIHAGLANRICACFARTIALTFQESSRFFPQGKTVYTGMPLRKTLFKEGTTQIFAQQRVDRSRPLLFISGGSQGSYFFNDLFLTMLDKLLEKYAIVYVSGTLDKNNAYQRLKLLRQSLNASQQKHFTLFKFITDELGDILRAADLAIVRSGANTVVELLAFHVPAILIPFPLAPQNEQYKNACFVKKINGGIIIEENKDTGKILPHTIDTLFATQQIASMKASLQAYNCQNGTEAIRKLIIPL
jgi:UDP-N-acetylglucosamine--N-acetylmuramyl-(pentapeptide) pyrophosphoryl-undecaprenol N-acetylglucosamine transferase